MPLFSLAQNCNCRKELNNYSGNLSVRKNEDICLTGTFSGDIEMNGGRLTVCGEANIGTVNFKQPASITFSNTAIVKIQSINSNDQTFLTNFCDSLVIAGGNFNTPFKLINHGKCRLNGGAFNSSLDFTNSDTLIVNTSLTLNQNCTFTNTKYFEINGNFTPNSGVLTFDNSCQLKINGDMILNGQDLNVTGGYVRVNNVNINSGSIVLNNACVFYVNSINIGGFVEGKGSRSTMVCTQNPNLNRQPSLKGNLSVCVKTGNFNPNSGTVEPPASIDCNNPIGGSECNPEAFGYDYFRLKPQISNDWNNSTSWEMISGTTWVEAPSGRYPGKGSAVLIGDGKVMTATVDVELSRLILGESGSGMIVCDPTQALNFTVNDTIEFNQQSSIELNRSTLTINGNLLTDIRCKGTPSASLILNVQNTQKNLVMVKSAGDSGDILNRFSYNMNGGTLGLADTLKISNLLVPGAGVLQTNGKLVLLSDANKTASVTEGSGNYIMGLVRVERYIPPIARRFRFVSPTVKNANLLQWQDDVFITGNNAAGNATGQQVGTLNSAGFDATQSFEPSLYWYNETKTGNQDNGWVAATNETPTLADYPLPVGKGYRLFIRGDRSDTNRLNGINNSQNEVTLDMYGELVTGNVIVPISYTNTGLKSEDGWNMIGNPYASAYDWHSFYVDDSLGAQFEPNVWVYDSKMNAYVSYNVLAGDGTFTNGIIPSGQSFWVKAIVPSGTITLKEKYKVESQQNDAIRTVRSGALADNVISIRLIKDSINEDEVIIKFLANATQGIDKYDTDKFWSNTVGISQYEAGENAFLDLSSRPLKQGKVDTIPLYYFVSENGSYTLMLSSYNSIDNNGAKVFLFDAQENTLVDIDTQPVYPFTVNLPNPAFGQTDRFSIIYFADTPDVVIPNYQYAEKVDSTAILINWGTLSEPAATVYTLQRGLDSLNFTSIATVNGTGSFREAADYEYLDTTADLSQDLYYRIGARDTFNTQLVFGPIMVVSHINTGMNRPEKHFRDGLVLYPVPTDGLLMLANRNVGFNGKVAIRICDMAGKEVMYETTGDHSAHSNILQLDISELKQGVYFMQVSNQSGQNAVLKIVKN